MVKNTSAIGKKSKTTTDFVKTSNHKIHLLILFGLSFLIYTNTLTHDYTQDDAIVIYDNMFTEQGVKGIPGLLKYDTFYGFFKEKGKAKLVSGGRYRPLTPIMFAIERDLFGKKPFWGHFFNVLWFSLLVVLLYKVLERLFLHKGESVRNRNMIFIACLIFAVHPIHTEVVANIKGRDEIVSLIGSLATLFYVLKWFDYKQIKYAILAGFFGFLALMSKENAITFLAVIPLSLMFFRDLSIGKSLQKTVPFLLGTIVFLIIRTSVLGLDFGDNSMELMNNPFIKINGNRYVPFSGLEWIATIIFIMGKYLQLLIIPHPLTHDYYPRHIEIMGFGDWEVWLSLLVYIGIIYMMVKYWKTHKTIAWSIFYFIATISIVSNIVFPIGTNMSERFLFMPSVGFALVIGSILSRLSKNVMMGIMGVVLLLFSIKSYTRNMVWQDDFTLFTTDVKTSIRSAKVLNAAGGALSNEASKEKNEAKKSKMLRQSIAYLNQSIEIHPNYKNAYLIRGNDHFYLGELDQAIKNYEKALQVSPGFKDANKNIGIALRDKGRLYGEKENNLIKAKEYLHRSLTYNQNDEEAIRLLAISYGMGGDHTNAIKYFKQVISLSPTNASAYANLSSAYKTANRTEEALEMQNKALSLDPEVYKKLRNKK